MFENIGSFFKKIIKNEPKELLVDTTQSKDAAKERLHIVLMQDRANVSADFLELMKEEIVDVIKKYIVVDESQIDVRLTNQENEDGTIGAPALHANIPILNIRNDLKGEVSKTDNNAEVVTVTENSDNDRTQIIQLVKEAVEDVNLSKEENDENKTLEIEIKSKESDLEDKTAIITEEIEISKDSEEETVSENEDNGEEPKVDEVENKIETEAENDVNQEVAEKVEEQNENPKADEENLNEDGIKEINIDNQEESKTEDETIQESENLEEDKPLTVDNDGNMNLEDLENKLDEEDDDDDDDVTFDDLLKAAEEEEKKLQSSENDSEVEEKGTKTEKKATPKKSTKKKTAKTKKNKKK